MHRFPSVRNGTLKSGEPWTDGTPVLLLELSTDIDFNERVQPVCLASDDHSLLQPSDGHSDAMIAGWAPTWRLDDYGTNMTQVHVSNVRLAVEEVPTRYVSTETRTSIVSTLIEQVA